MPLLPRNLEHRNGHSCHLECHEWCQGVSIQKTGPLPQTFPEMVETWFSQTSPDLAGEMEKMRGYGDTKKP